MFLIQLGHPKINTIPKQEFKTVREVFLRLFKSPEEGIFLFWNEIPVRFRYARDLHDNFNEMLALVWLVQKESKGATTVSFQNQILKMNLTVEWEMDRLTIQGDFEAFEFLYDSYATAMNRSSSLELSKKAFLCEWNTLFRQLITAIDASNCSIEDGIERRRIEVLAQTANLIESYGRLYTR